MDAFIDTVGGVGWGGMWVRVIGVGDGDEEAYKLLFLEV